VRLDFGEVDGSRFIQISLDEKAYWIGANDGFLEQIGLNVIETRFKRTHATSNKEKKKIKFTSNDHISLLFENTVNTDTTQNKLSLFFNTRNVLKFTISSSILVFVSIQISQTAGQGLNATDPVLDQFSFYHQPAVHITTDSLLGQYTETRPQCDTFINTNPRLHISTMLRRFSNLDYTHFLIEKIMKNSSEAKTSKRGVLLLPFDLTRFFEILNEKPAHPLLIDLLYNTGTLSVHLPCVDLKQIVSQKYLHTHLVDTPGIKLGDTLVLNPALMALVLLSTYAITIADNEVIMPSFQNIWPDSTVLKDAGFVKTVFGEVFKSFCLFFDRAEVFLGYLTKLEDGLDVREEFKIYEQIENSGQG